MTTSKFSIPFGEYSFELEYTDLKNKKLSKLCKLQPIKSLQTAAVVVLILFAIVFVYDYIKDIGRNVSNTKDLFNNQGSVAKFVGFTKGNMTRMLIKTGLLITAIIMYYLSNSMAKEVYCLTDGPTLEEINKDIEYNTEGVPVKFKST